MRISVEHLTQGLQGTSVDLAWNAAIRGVGFDGSWQGGREDGGWHDLQVLKETREEWRAAYERRPTPVGDALVVLSECGIGSQLVAALDLAAAA